MNGMLRIKLTQYHLSEEVKDRQLIFIIKFSSHWNLVHYLLHLQHIQTSWEFACPLLHVLLKELLVKQKSAPNWIISWFTMQLLRQQPHKKQRSWTFKTGYEQVMSLRFLERNKSIKYLTHFNASVLNYCALLLVLLKFVSKLNICLWWVLWIIDDWIHFILILLVFRVFGEVEENVVGYHGWSDSVFICFVVFGNLFYSYALRISWFVIGFLV